MKRSFKFRTSFGSNCSDNGISFSPIPDAPNHLKPYFDDPNSSRILSPLDVNSSDAVSTNKSPRDKDRLYSSFMSVDSDFMDQDNARDTALPMMLFTDNSEQQSTHTPPSNELSSKRQNNLFIFGSENVEREPLPNHNSEDANDGDDENESESSSSSIFAYRKKVEEYRSNLMTAKLTNIGLRNGSKHLESELSSQKTKNHVLKKEMEKMKEDFTSSLTRKLDEISFLNDTIRTLQDSLSSQQPNRLSEMVSKLTQQVQLLNTKNESLKSELSHRTKEVSEREKLNVKQNQVIRGLESKISDGKIFSDQLQKHLDLKAKREVEMGREMERMKHVVEKLQSEMNANGRSLQEEVTSLRRMLMASEAEKEEMKKTRNEAVSQCENLKMKCVMMENEMKKTHEIHNRNMMQMSESMHVNENRRRDDFDRLRMENERLNREYGRVVTENGKYQKQLIELSGSGDERRRLEKILREKNEQIDLLQREVLMMGASSGEMRISRRSVSVQTEKVKENRNCEIKMQDSDLKILSNIHMNMCQLHELIVKYFENEELDENILCWMDGEEHAIFSPAMRRNGEKDVVVSFRMKLRETENSMKSLKQVICDQMADRVGHQCFVQ